jgi:hypothetical protein
MSGTIICPKKDKSCTPLLGATIGLLKNEGVGSRGHSKTDAPSRAKTDERARVHGIDFLKTAVPILFELRTPVAQVWPKMQKTWYEPFWASPPKEQVEVLSWRS